MRVAGYLQREPFLAIASQGSYDDWSRVVMAVSTVFDKSHDGLVLVTAWSTSEAARLSGKANEDLCRTLYTQANGSLTYATIEHYKKHFDNTLMRLEENKSDTEPASSGAANVDSGPQQGLQLVVVPPMDDQQREAGRAQPPSSRPFYSRRIDHLWAGAEAAGWMSSKADRLDEFNFSPVKVLHEVTVLFQTWWPNGKPTSSDRDDSEVDLFGSGSGGEDGGSGSPIAGGPLQQVDDGDSVWEDADASQGSDGPLAAEGGACLDLGGDHLAGGGVSGSALAVFSRELAA